VAAIGSFSDFLDASHDFLYTVVSSRASQSSMSALQGDVTLVKSDVGMVKTSVGTILDQVAGLDSSKLDIAVSTRASQASVNDLATQVSSRASQSSLDALSALGATFASKTDVAGLVQLDVISAAQSALGTSIGTRASQTSLDALDTKLSGHLTTYHADTDNSLRAQIERELAKGGPRIALFYLPGSQNGELDFVQAIVLDTINRNLAAGAINQQVANAAMTSYNKGVAYMTAAPANYKKAYDQFVQAYQAVVN
jgi:hypothetical protein